MPPLKSLPDLHPPSAAAAAPLRSQYLRDIPILDLASPDKSQVAAQIGLACQIYGFFQVVNHGIEEELIRRMVGGRRRCTTERTISASTAIRSRSIFRFGCLSLRLSGAAHGNQLLPQVSRTELTYGLPAHTDPNALTILLQEPHVVGLHVLRDGEWTAVDPRQAPSSSTSAISFRRSAMGGTKSVASGGGEFREGEDVGGVLLLPV
ncbi:hypothetical protein HPP92_004725 [Vanilla planifolia]|uniref:Uncharacterized protein n=1 Tax=Vanilla planifolia TaxID=51239 RepID=A0A835RKD2_VANPL|nr:hypothetical protein HPP92_004725 [Vanilla planifolia]